jgi:hypothetical protein
MQQTGTGPDGIDRRGSHELIETAQLHRLTKQALGAQGQLRAGIERSDLKALLSEVETVPTRAAARIDDMSAGASRGRSAGKAAAYRPTACLRRSYRRVGCSNR